MSRIAGTPAHQDGVDVKLIEWATPALGALTRNAIAAVLGGLAWVQIVEVGLLQHFVPALAKWLPTGAAVAITTPGQTHGLLPWGAATVVLTGWALALALVATRVSLRRELR